MSCICHDVSFSHFTLNYHLKKAHLVSGKNTLFPAQFSSDPKENLKAQKIAAPVQVIIVSLHSLAKDISSMGWN